MAKSYKDRDKWDLPRVPDWARVQRPEQIIENEKRKQMKKKKLYSRDEYDED